jgi:uncharacterized membrane protein
MFARIIWMFIRIADLSVTENIHFRTQRDYIQAVAWKRSTASPRPYRQILSTRTE